MTAGIGHNSGRVNEPGFAWRKHVWSQARRDLLPTLPIEVVRLRVRRAAELGLPYKTYAGVRASSGHDLVGFLFSTNALRVMRAGTTLPPDRAQKLGALVNAARIAVGVPVTAPQIDASHPAPGFQLNWADVRSHLKTVSRAAGHPSDRFLLVGDTAIEREWAEAAGLAGHLAADFYFPQPGA